MEAAASELPAQDQPPPPLYYAATTLPQSLPPSLDVQQPWQIDHAQHQPPPTLPQSQKVYTIFARAQAESSEGTGGGGGGGMGKSYSPRMLMLVGGLLVIVAAAVGVGVAVGMAGATADAGSSKHVVVAAVKLPYSKSDFDAARQQSFRRGVAVAATTSWEKVEITGIKETPTRRLQPAPARRAAAGSIRVDFSIRVASESAATSLAGALTEDALNKALVAEGLEKSVMVATPKATTTDSSEASGDTSSPTSAPPRPPLSPSSSPRRASYESFETCEEVSAQFGGSAAARRATGSLFPTAQSEPSNHFPQFPPDYCEHCNCSIPRKTDNERMYMFGDAPMAAAAGRPLLRLPLPLLRGFASRKMFFGPQTD